MGNIFSESSENEDINDEILDENDFPAKKIKQSKIQNDEYVDLPKNKTKRRKINAKIKSKANRRY